MFNSKNKVVRCVWLYMFRVFSVHVVFSQG